MRVFLLFAAVVGLACGAAVPQHKTFQRFPAPRSSRDLQDDLNDFLALIPVDEIVNIVLNYVANDAEVQAALQYLMSDEFESIIVYIDQQPEVYELLNFIEDSGLAIYDFLNEIHGFLGIPPIERPASRLRRSTRSLKGMLDEILAILPVDEIRALYYEKLETSPEFAELIARLSSEEFHQLVLRVGELEAVQNLIQTLRDAGIDVDAIADFVRQILGWTSSSKAKPIVPLKKIQRFPAKPSKRDLQDDLNDFLALIPVDEIVNIVLNYVANDAEVQAALQYLISDEFESIVVYIDQQPEVYELLNFIEDSGLAIYDFLNEIHGFLGIPPIERPASRLRRSTRSLKGMLDEILAILPVDEIRALYNEKLESSPDFAELIARLSSEEFHQLVLRVGELEAVQNLIQLLRDAGIDVDAIADFVRQILGWTSSSKATIKKIQRFPAKPSNRDLQDDLNDFLALIPVDEIVNIVLNYVANDAEVQAALQYLMSDEFESIVVYIDQQPELYDLLNFLEASGLDPYGFLNEIHGFLGIPPIERPAIRLRRSTRSLKGMLDEILAILPVDDIRALYYEKLESSPDFAELIARLSSDEFHQLVLRVGELEAVQNLIQSLRDAGIDVDAIADFVRQILGWAF